MIGRIRPPLGAILAEGGARFSVWSVEASQIWACIFEEQDRETRIELARGDDGIFSTLVPDLTEGARYGLRADGPYDPADGFWFDPDKLLVDPYAVEIDRPYVYDPRLAARRGEGVETAPLMPKAILRKPLPDVVDRPAMFRPGGLIYELNVRAFTKLHPDVPEADRGTIRGLAHPAVIAHLKRIGVSAVELMPVTAWIDERHLGPLGLTNAWGYNPVTFMALDPRLAPGGIADLRYTVAALRAEGIGVILDIVFNHTGESDAFGPTLSLRGLDARTYYRHRPDGRPVNDSGTGNTLACDRPVVRRLILDSLRHFVLQTGVDGFRFDLAPILGRTDQGFDPKAALFAEIAADPALADRVLIAEPWDIGPGGYQLGNFPDGWLEWNDRFRDDIRRFWRGDAGMTAALATRLAGSSDLFGRRGTGRTRTVNFVAAHDGMTLADVTAYEHKHNRANGEDNRDGHGENLSWNNGVDGGTDDAAVVEARRRDAMALLATLFAARGTIMLTAGDEFGRSQHGNNNAYCQDNELAWIGWQARDNGVEAHVAALAMLRADHPALRRPRLLTGEGAPPDVEWFTLAGAPMHAGDWSDPERRGIAMVLASNGGRLAIAINGGQQHARFGAATAPHLVWRNRLQPGDGLLVRRRSVAFLEERPK